MHNPIIADAKIDDPKSSQLKGSPFAVRFKNIAACAIAATPAEKR